MGNLVLTRRSGEAIVLLQNEKEMATIEVQGFSGAQAWFSVSAGGMTETLRIRKDDPCKIAGGQITWLHSRVSSDVIRVALDYSQEVKIVRRELCK